MSSADKLDPLNRLPPHLRGFASLVLDELVDRLRRDLEQTEAGVNDKTVAVVRDVLEVE